MPELHSPKRSSILLYLAKCSLYFFKIIGLLPISAGFTKGNFVAHVSRVGYVYNSVVITLIFSVLFFSVPYITEVHYVGDTVLTIRLTIVKVIIGSIVLIIVWLIMCVRQRVLVDIIRRFVDVDNGMINGGYGHRRKTPDQLITAFAGNMIIWGGVMTTDVLISETFDINFFYWIPMITPSFVISWLLIQYSMILGLLSLRFENVNRAIAEINPEIESVGLGDYEMSGEIRQIPLRGSVVGSLLAFRRLHADYYEVANDIVHFYAIPLLVGVTFFCGTIIYSAYYLIVPLLTVSWGYEIILNTSNSVLMVIMQLFPIVMMAASVNSLTREMNLTADAVHKLLASSTASRQVKSELKKFSLELLHKNVEFTAYGVFPLDCTLVHSIVSVVVTYLIILVQFRKIE